MTLKEEIVYPVWMLNSIENLEYFDVSNIRYIGGGFIKDHWKLEFP